MNAAIHLRAGFICIGLAVLFSIYSGRLVHLQVGMHGKYSEMAAESTAKKKDIPAQRGLITDSRGEVLALNVPIYQVIADGKLLRETKADLPGLSAILARHLSMDAAQLLEKIDSADPYIPLRDKVDAVTVSALKSDIREARVRGIMFEAQPQRSYPNEDRLAHVLGFLNREGRGVQGVEMMMEPYLRGENGFVFTERDRTGREIVAYRGMRREARDGMTVELTVDMALQEIVERELDDAYRQLKPNMITAVFVRPGTGEVLAMASRPAFNPNQPPGQAGVETTKNRAVIEMFEPGSTFKIVVIAAALNENAVTPASMFHCENGNFHYAGRTLRDVKAYGPLSVHDIMVKSSNIGCAKIAMQIGADTFHEYIRRFGFGERTGIGLPGEIHGIVRPRHSWSGLSITRIPMGHEVAVTPMQSVMSLAVVANGGNMMLPQIVRSVKDGSGREVVSFRPQVVRRVISEQAAASVAASLSDVVSDRGTARHAAITGFQVAGKTGTAQRVDPKGGYTPGKYVVSFAGYFPASRPEVAGIIVVDDARTPGGLNYGGTVAAPIFSRIGEGFVRHLDMVADAPVSPDGATVALVPGGGGNN